MTDELKHIILRMDVAIELYNNDPTISEGYTISTLHKLAIEFLAELERRDLPEIKVD